MKKKKNRISKRTNAVEHKVENTTGGKGKGKEKTRYRYVEIFITSDKPRRHSD
jgi:hypothetical protein